MTLSNTHIRIRHRVINKIENAFGQLRWIMSCIENIALKISRPYT